MKRKIKNPGRHARKKGLDFERSVAIILRPLFPECRRQLENHARDAKGIDLQGTGHYKIQCKKLKDYAPISRIREIQCDEDLGDIPILITAADGKEPMAVLPLRDLVDLMKAQAT